MTCPLIITLRKVTDVKLIRTNDGIYRCWEYNQGDNTLDAQSEFALASRENGFSHVRTVHIVNQDSKLTVASSKFAT